MKSLFFIVARSMRQHLLSTIVTVIAAGMASGLVMSVFTVSEQSRRAFTGGDIGYDAVLGAKGSELQHVLNTVFHLETSPGNIPWSLYQEMKRNRAVKYAIPYAVGDNLYGFRIVGTSSEIFTDYTFNYGERFEFEADGVPFDEGSQSAVIGSVVAQELGLRKGDTFRPYHGLQYIPGSAPHEDLYKITGILKPTNTPSDRVIWIPVEGIFRMEGHKIAGGTQEVERGAAIPDEWKEVSAVMIKFHKAGAGMFLRGEINRGDRATLAWPIADVLGRFFLKMGWITKVLTYVAYLVVVVAAFGLLASIYNTMNERRREFAILRALGARKRTVFSVIVLEAGTIALLGSALGYLVYGGILGVSARLIRAETGVVLDMAAAHPALAWTPLGMVLVGALAGVFPAIKAYSTDVARTLA